MKKEVEVRLRFLENEIENVRIQDKDFVQNTDLSFLDKRKCIQLNER